MYRRSDRLKELLLREVNRILPCIKDLQSRDIRGLVTLTSVELSKDLKDATVFFSVLGQESDKKSAGEALNNARHFVRQKLKSRLTLKYIPMIMFEFDSTPETAARIETILDRIHDESS